MNIFGFAVSNDSKKLYINCSIVKKKQNVPKLDVYPPQLVVYDIASNEIIKSYEIPYGVMAGVITIRNKPDNIILGGQDFYDLDLKTGALKKVFGVLNVNEGEDVKNSLVVWNTVVPGDHGIFTTPYYTATDIGYLIIDTNDGAIRELKGKDVLFEYVSIVSPDKNYLYAVMDELIKIDFKTGETLKIVPVGRGTCYCLSLSSDGKKIYVGPAGNDISVYDTSDLTLLGVITLEGDGVLSHGITL